MPNRPGSADLQPFVIADGAVAVSITEAYVALVRFYERVVSWYLYEKARKGRHSKRLRVMAISLVVIGGIIPLVSAAVPSVPSSIGYILLAVAGGLQVFDRYFGFSTAWSRYLRAAMEANGLLLMLQLHWMELVPNGRVPEDQQRAWALLRDYASRLASTINDETASWSSEFAAGLSALESRFSTSNVPPNGK
jgi:hypothetical protein